MKKIKIKRERDRQTETQTGSLLAKKKIRGKSFVDKLRLTNGATYVRKVIVKLHLVKLS